MLERSKLHIFVHGRKKVSRKKVVRVSVHFIVVCLKKTTFANKIEQNRYPDITVAHSVSEKASRHGFSLSQREANTTRIF